MTSATTFVDGLIFNGNELLENHCAIFADNQLVTISADTKSARQGQIVSLNGDILCAGYADLQVNGGGCVMLNDDPSVDTLSTIAAAHWQLGTRCLLPTLITDIPELTHAAIEATKSAIAKQIPGIAGLHLEGPHLSITRKGAHDANLIRPMLDSDLALLLQAAKQLPILKVTVAPENVTIDQVQILVEGGVILSLGHSDADYDTCMRYRNAGASCVTHLFNAMSQLGNREPGLAGAALDGNFSIGLIADGIHVHPTTIRMAWTAKQQKDKFYLVTDAMAPAGTDMQSFQLTSGTIHRRDGKLTLEDGTLAGADLDITTAIRTMHQTVGIELSSVMRAAISTPRKLINRNHTLCNSRAWSVSEIIRIKSDLNQASPIADSMETY